MSKETTTIALTIEVVERLKSLGKKGETYDQIVRRLIGEKGGPS